MSTNREIEAFLLGEYDRLRINLFLIFPIGSDNTIIQPVRQLAQKGTRASCFFLFSALLSFLRQPNPH